MTSLLLLVSLVALVTGLAVALARRPVLHLTADDAADLAVVRRRRTLARILGPVVGVAAGIAVLELGPGLGLAVPLAGASVLLGLLLVVALAEVTVPGSRSTVRTATLRPRRVDDLVARSTGTAAVLGVVTLAGLLAIGWAMGDPDDLGRAGRSLVTSYRDGHGDLRGSGHGPWPGSFYAAPMLGVLLLAVALCALTLAVVARRPQPSARSAAADLVLRRGVAEVVVHALAACAWLLALPVAGLMAIALFSVDGAPGWYAVLGGWCLVTALAAGGLGGWGLGRAFVQPRVEARPRRAEPVVS